MKNTNNQKLISLKDADDILFTADELVEIRNEYNQKATQWEQEVQQEVANEIRKERKKNGLTQEQLAKKIKTSRNNIVAIESGKRNVTIETLDRIAEAMGKELVITFK